MFTVLDTNLWRQVNFNLLRRPNKCFQMATRFVDSLGRYIGIPIGPEHCLRKKRREKKDINKRQVNYNLLTKTQ